MSDPVPATWVLRYHGFDPVEEGRREALCTLGNGYLATRGAAAEAVADGVHYPGTYLAGCYNRLHSRIDGFAREDESLVNIPNWLPLRVAAEDDPWLSVESADVVDHDQWLDIRRGLLHREVRFRDPAGRTTLVRQVRFVHMAQPHLAGLHTSVTAEDWAGTLRICSEIDGQVANTGVARYRDLDSQHLDIVGTEVVDRQTTLLKARTNQSGVTIATAARTLLVGRPSADWQPIREPGRIGCQLELPVRQGEEIAVDKIVAVYTSQDRAIAEPANAALAAVGTAGDFAELRERHELAWEHLWRRFRIELTDFPAEVGGDEALRTVRLHLFHVLQTVSPNSTDLDVGVPARGLHGEAYRGHVFWDELFVLPLLNLRLPTLTRSLLRYRWRRLPEARRAAAAEGYAGAMFPWQSGSDGREESQRLHLNPLSGHWLPDPTFRQRHVGIAIAYNVWQYYQVTGNVEFLGEYGAEMILEIARFFASLTQLDEDRNRYVIRGVMGPDEFHTGYPDAELAGVDNNAYTNVMVVWLLQRALETLEVLPEWRRAELVETLRLETAETDRWRQISGLMFVPFHDGDIISQFEGYEQLAELDFDAYRREYGDIQRLDRILEAEGDSVNRYRASKQADVLMLYYLLTPQELSELLNRLGYRMSPDMTSRTVDYYLARTSHGSTLSAVVHAWVLARLHREQALEHFLRALSSDVADIQGGTTAEGIHLAAMAGSVDLLERCFTGISLRHDTLWLDPFWPEQLGTLQLTLRYRDLPLTVGISDGHVSITAGSGPGSPIRVRCNGQAASLAPGDTVTLSRAAVPAPR